MGVIGLWLSRNPFWLHERIEAPIVESSAMRWYRCLGSGRPLLDAPSARWTLNYSWSDGFGPGSVAVEIGSDGHARMQAWPADGGSIHRSAVLSPGQVRRIAALVDETGLLCQVPEAHPEFTVEDRGTYVVSVRGGKQDADVFVDECHEVADGAAFGAVLEGVRTRRGVLG